MAKQRTRKPLPLRAFPVRVIIHFDQGDGRPPVITPMDKRFTARNWKEALLLARADAEGLLERHPDARGRIAWIGYV